MKSDGSLHKWKWNLLKIFNKNHIQYSHWVITFSERERDVYMSVLSDIFDKDIYNSLCTTSLNLYFVIILVSAENTVLHKYIVA